MKNLFKFLGAVASALSISAVAAFAQDAQPFTVQLEDKVIPVGEFSALNIANDFEVTIDRGSCNVRLTVDDALSPYVQVYVRAKTLYIAYDEKSVPKDIKKFYSGRNAPVPTFRAIIHVPELSGLTLTDNASITSAAAFPSDFFQLNVADKAQVKSITVNAASAAIALNKNAQAVLSIAAEEKVEINNDGNSVLKLSANTPVINIGGNGNANISVGAECPSVNVNGNGNSRIAVATKAEKVLVNAIASSRVVLSGNAQEAAIKGDKNADIDAENIELGTANVNLSGNSKATVNVNGSVDATLIGGSTLFYVGTPEFKISKIVRSTVAPKGTPLK